MLYIPIFCRKSKRISITITNAKNRKMSKIFSFPPLSKTSYLMSTLLKCVLILATMTVLALTLLPNVVLSYTFYFIAILWFWIGSSWIVRRSTIVAPEPPAVVEFEKLYGKIELN